jgi:hypothetical protein
MLILNRTGNSNFNIIYDIWNGKQIGQVFKLFYNNCILVPTIIYWNCKLYLVSIINYQQKWTILQQINQKN